MLSRQSRCCSGVTPLRACRLFAKNPDPAIADRSCVPIPRCAARLPPPDPPSGEAQRRPCPAAVPPAARILPPLPCVTHHATGTTRSVLSLFHTQPTYTFPSLI